MSEILIELNGEPHRVESPLTVGELLARLEMKRGRVAVELNRIVVPRAEYHRTALRAGDRIEIINFVGGG